MKPDAGLRDRLLLKPSEAARLLGLSVSRTQELIATGDIPSCAIGERGRTRIPLAELQAFIAARTAKRTQELRERAAERARRRRQERVG